MATTAADSDRARLRAYAFVGASTQIGLAWVNDQLSLTIEELIDELVDVFRRLASQSGA
jgi:hypothetical protein